MDLASIRESVFEKKPVLGKIYKTRGSSSLVEYSNTASLAPKGIPEMRVRELLNVFHAELSQIFPASVADSATKQLQSDYYVSTADHHGVLTHPFSMNGLFMQSMVQQARKTPNIFVLSCAGISLNNSSFPRGLFFHDDQLSEQRLHLVSLKHRHHPVYGFGAYGKREITRLTKEIAALVKTKKISAKVGEQICELLEKVYAAPELFSYKYFSEQVSKTNFELWKEMPGQREMNLLYLEQEGLVRELLVRHHLYQNTILQTLLCDSRFHSVFAKYFKGIWGAFSEDGKGTFLFWGVHRNKRIQLQLRGRELVNVEHKFKIPLRPDDLKEALTSRVLMPSMALSFIVLSFYYGLSCGGGFSQVNYLPEMKTAWLKLLGELHIQPDTFLETLNTSHLAADFALTFLSDRRTLVQASSLDFLLYGAEETWSSIKKIAASAKLETALDAMMPEFYKIISGKNADVKTPIFDPAIYV